METFTALFGFPVLIVSFIGAVLAGLYAARATPTHDELMKLLEEEQALLHQPKKDDPPRRRRG